MVHAMFSWPEFKEDVEWIVSCFFVWCGKSPNGTIKLQFTTTCTRLSNQRVKNGVDSHCICILVGQFTLVGRQVAWGRYRVDIIYTRASTGHELVTLSLPQSEEYEKWRCWGPGFSNFTARHWGGTCTRSRNVPALFSGCLIAEEAIWMVDATYQLCFGGFPWLLQFQCWALKI